MADQEEDFSSLPLPDRFAHKNWKVRKEAYEAAAKEFDNAQTESDPVVKQFIQDPNLWKGAVTDANAAAHQEALNALCSFLQICGMQGCTRSRSITLGPLAEKGLISTKPSAKAKATEAILLYIELDKADPVLEELLPVLSHKLPKIVAATLAAFTVVIHQYGTKTVNPKPILQVLPKVYGHADKNVRAEAQNLTVELYRWLRDGMKPLFWNDLKPVQQQDLDKLFEKVKDEAPPKPERLLRSQQRAAAEAALSGQGQGHQVGGEADEEEEAEEELEPQIMAIDVFQKIPKDVLERLGSSKWKDRKEALEDLHKAIDAPAIEEGPFDDILRALAKCMKDANVGVVTEAANCIELLAKGLRRSFTKYRSTVFSPVLERLKERKQTVIDALAGALDAVFTATSLPECMEETLAALGHKNPQVKLEATRFLIRSLKTTREAPSIPEVKQLSDTSSKLLSDSQEVQRNAAAEVLGTLLKIMGERIMNVHLEGLDDIRKAKIKEYSETAEVKAKYRPKAAPAPKAAAAAPTAQKRPVTKKPGVAPTPGAKRAAPPPAPPAADETPPTPQPKTLSRPGSGVPKPGLTGPRGLKPPSSFSAAKKLPQPGAAALASPKRVTQPPPPQVEYEDEEEPMPAPKPVRGLTGRTLAKPSQSSEPIQQPVTHMTQACLTSVEKHELDELRVEVERLRSSNETLRTESSKLNSQVNELQNQNAQLIEDHTRDVLSIKAKETQLVRARSDAETAEQKVITLQREVDRLKRELGRMGRANSPRSMDYGGDPLQEASAAALNGAYPTDTIMKRRTVASPTSGLYDTSQRVSSRSTSGSPVRMTFNRPSSRTAGSGQGATLGHESVGVLSDSDGRSSNGSSSGAYKGFKRDGESAPNGGAPASSSSSNSASASGGVESWRRAAEVTQNLKARIELMKARQGMSRG